MAVRLSASRAVRPLPPGKFLLLSRPQGHSAAGSIRSIEKSNDLIGIRTDELPACSIVSQSTSLPRAPLPKLLTKIFSKLLFWAYFSLYSLLNSFTFYFLLVSLRMPLHPFYLSSLSSFISPFLPHPPLQFTSPI
jgi:hypothetical protein